MQIDYKNIIIDVKEGTTVSELLKDEIQKAKCKVIACKFNNEIKSILSNFIDNDISLFINNKNKDKFLRILMIILKIRKEILMIILTILL